MYSEAVAEWQTAMKLLGNEPGAAAWEKRTNPPATKAPAETDRPTVAKTDRAAVLF